LDRAIAGYASRKLTISQKIPTNWPELAERGARRVKTTFKEENVDVVLAADEMFIRFHEGGSQVLAPKVVRRVGLAATIDGKDGCTVLPTLPTMDMLSSHLFPPMIIFKGTFGGTLMKKWSKYFKSFVLFTKNHWMTSETTALYLRWFMMIYSGKKINLIIDYAPAHNSEEVRTWTKTLNEASTDGTSIVIEWIDPSLTSVYQPGDITVNKPLKSKIRAHYYSYLTDCASSFKPGARLK